MGREDIRFPSAGLECGGWLYRPDGAEPRVACVVMAHGFGALKEARLDAYAERFAAAGYAALVFDYRHFGASEGEPRRLIDIARQQEDWRAAIAHARTLDRVDAERIALWGSSFSGGHVLALGADDARIAAIVSQAPFMSGPATLRSAGFVNNLRMTGAALRDIAAGARGRTRPMPLVGPPGTLAVMNSPDADPGYRALYSPGFEWHNEFLPRRLMQFPLYSPVRRAGDVRCPLLVQAAREDVVTPPEPARKAARRAPRGELKEYDAGHFDVYVGELFETVVADQVEFLDRHLASA